MYHYSYILFNTIGNQYSIPNQNDYYTICTKELENHPEVQVVSLPLQEQPYLIRVIHAIHNSGRLARYINLPFKEKWYPLYFRSKFKDNERLCFVLLNHKLPISYLSYLKGTFPDCRIVMIHRDFLRVSQAVNPPLPQNPILDLEMTYDEGESAKYGFPHFSEFESKIDVKIEAKFESDVFFAGKAKDRLPFLMEAYKKFNDAGLKVYFFLTGVPKEEQVPLSGIEYASRFMTYGEMLYHTVNSRCVLEAVQGGGQTGYTSRFLESVIYGKKMITNHDYIKRSKFYDPHKIQIVKSVEDVDVDFVKEGSGFVDYGYAGEFSPLRMIDRIDEELERKFNK